MYSKVFFIYPIIKNFVHIIKNSGWISPEYAITDLIGQVDLLT